ncbi:MAG: transposase [Thermoplasmata archaeon]
MPASEEQPSSLRVITVGGRRYRQRVRYEWDPARQHTVTRILEHLGPEKPRFPRGGPPDLRGIQAIVPAGHLALFVSISREFQLRETLQEVCPSPNGQVATRLWALVLNQSAGRRSLPEVGPWVLESPLARWLPANETTLGKDALAGGLDVVYSRQEGERTAYRRVHAIQERMAQAVERLVGRDPAHYFVYHDVCRIRYNGSHCDWAEPGHGAVEGRPHVGIGMVTGRQHHFPLHSLPVKGSMHDAKTLGPVASELKERGMEGLTLVMDRGFPSRKTVKQAQEAGFDVLVGCPENSKEVKRALRRWTDEEVERPGQVVPRSSDPRHAQYYRGWDGELYGAKGQLVVALDPWRRSEERVSRDLMLREVKQGGWERAI